MDDIMASAISNSMAMSQAQTQANMSVSMAKQSMDFEASMVSKLIDGGAQATESIRNAGLAAQGIGGKLNITV